MSQFPKHSAFSNQNQGPPYAPPLPRGSTEVVGVTQKLGVIEVEASEVESWYLELERLATATDSSREAIAVQLEHLRDRVSAYLRG